MHAAGCPGSHVVIRYTGEDVPKETIIDAAVLAAANSKANQVGKAPVSLYYSSICTTSCICYIIITTCTNYKSIC